MANDKAATLLTSLPLEVRHTIFDYAAARKTKPKKLLRYWFEKKEAKELVAKYVADNPNDPAPQVVYHQEPDVDSDVPEPEPDEDEDEDDGDEDGENEDEEDGEDGEEDGEDNGNGENEENEDDEVDQDGGMHDIGDAEGSEEQPMEANDDSHIALPSQASHTPQISAQPGSDDHNADDVSVISEDHAEVDAETQDDDGDQVMADEDDEYARNEEEGDDEEDATDATAAAVPPPAVVISSHHKWRHIPNFMRISHCPPPVELLLASKQLNEEAKNWFYDVAVLRVSATSSFAHTSFFEEAFSQITEAAFSPMENIRKVEVLFVWDTTWLRAEETGCAEAIFPALLRQRADFVHQILSQAPDLREVTVHWHDSAEDNESANFMLDILAPFHSLNANMQIKEHYIAANTKPHKNSIAGQRRLEFQRIVDAGLDRLF
ncbi:hypothetical protein DE146DRAFT_623277 [Phaeosphaeria sp. MPI-PUGE-AT-0046c]|nr:hypothetical protein DE146DRAFT_623277 [Phaeosphaeria sp. MPI-PUGE-AT-0046c]